MNIQESITKKELCQKCKFHSNTLRNYLKFLNIKTGYRKILTPKELEIFLDFYNSKKPL